MIYDNYFNLDPQESDLTSYEEQLLINYDNYLESNNADSLAANHYGLKLDDLREDYLDDDYNSEYDENDWEEEDYNLMGDYDESKL
ncbi:hypothetical protein [Flavobacterium sp. H4147]|uniref:hypothetical protein n=1 Tax=Flavobacterium sp. H4147 TaxID=3034149 RepID=UPI0023ED799A|nr:hypothetical protein [Flavobacterium sp. H4147]